MQEQRHSCVQEVAKKRRSSMGNGPPYTTRRWSWNSRMVKGSSPISDITPKSRKRLWTATAFKASWTCHQATTKVSIQSAVRPWLASYKTYLERARQDLPCSITRRFAFMDRKMRAHKQKQMTRCHNFTQKWLLHKQQSWLKKTIKRLQPKTRLRLLKMKNKKLSNNKLKRKVVNQNKRLRAKILQPVWARSLHRNQKQKL